MTSEDRTPGAVASPMTRVRTALAYFVMIAATVALFLAIRVRGRAIVRPALVGVAHAAVAHAGPSDTLLHVLLALVVVIIAARGLGAVFRLLNQPPVIGEVLAGILLGPSLLGRVAPFASSYLLPPPVAPYLSVIAQVGVILYMFLVGLELDLGRLRHSSHATLAISHASIVVPFLLGATMALPLFPRLAPATTRFTPFALFLGVSMSVTAFPVLARILTDRRAHKTQLGIVALACAAVDDVTAWCLLALVVAVTQARPGRALITFALTVAYLIAMFVAVRPLAVRWARRYERAEALPQSAMAAVCVALLASALATEAIGIHAIFGAFLLGAVLPSEGVVARQLIERLEDVVVVLLLPAFFAFTGMRTQIGLVRGSEQWLICLALIAIASVGKFGGSFVAARLTGMAWRPAAALGILMNTRGLMELIVLNLGLDLGAISPTLFAMLVLMALVTTFATTPIFHGLTRGRAVPDLLHEGA